MSEDPEALSAVWPREAAREWLWRAQQLGHVGYLDVQLTTTLLQMVGSKDLCTAMLCALTSRHVSQGHVCLPLAHVATFEPWTDEQGADLLLPLRGMPESEQAQRLEQSGLAGAALLGRPFVLEHGRLYLRRLYEHEAALAANIEQRVQQTFTVPTELQGMLAQLFPEQAPSDDALALDPGQMALGFRQAAPDLQRRAAEVALARAFTVVSGGPGTGKTSTVVKILALFVQRALLCGESVPRILLLAPTGKAAARLSESIQQARAQLQCAEDVRAAITQDATTIHRALGIRPMGEPAFGPDRLLPADIVLVDEASMVDLALMRRLLAAVAPQARVILLGDRDQLASVEAGAVLGDVCGAGLSQAQRAGAALEPCIVQLERSYRYRAESGIGRLALALRRGQVKEALEVLASGKAQDVVLHPPLGDGDLGLAAGEVVQGYRAFLQASSAEAALQAFGRFRVLCALRRGPEGVDSVNQRIEQLLARRGLLRRGGPYYRGRPLMVTRNDPGTRLNNGDVGLVWPEAAGTWDTPLRAVFPGGSGTGVRTLSPARLPPHETVFAMTIHKSQGSEFDHVLVVLPVEPTPLLCRELLYTAVTRAKRRVTIFGSVDAVRMAIERPITRTSGLRERLWNAQLVPP